MIYSYEDLQAILEIFAYMSEDLHIYRNDEGIMLSVICSDLFYWGTTDSEVINPADIAALRKAKEDVLALGQFDDWFALLYAARQRKMRPQGAYYKVLPAEIHFLFDECGPERSVGIGNPDSQTKYQQGEE